MINQEVMLIKVDEDYVDQRIDNFLIKKIKNVPKSHIYKIIRSGEVRVNKKRIKADYKLNLNDQIRLPPLKLNLSKIKNTSPDLRIKKNIVYEDDWFLIVNKPEGIASHGGSGISLGLIESLRIERDDLRYLELVHRLDKNTSGLILVAKKRAALRSLQELFRNKKIIKKYLTLVKGEWLEKKIKVEMNLKKIVTKDGQQVVKKSKDGKLSQSIFRLVKYIVNLSLIDVELLTGKTHQIRVQLAEMGFPIAGDDKYGDFSFNRTLLKRGLKRMFLHAYYIEFMHPFLNKKFTLEVGLPDSLKKILDE
ncbi:MAG: RluA family pseudouridine synthase [Nitrosomonadales bacterium]